MTGQPAMQPASIRYESGSLHWNNTTTTTTVPEREELGMGLVGGRKKEVMGGWKKVNDQSVAYLGLGERLRKFKVAGGRWVAMAGASLAWR